MYSEIIGNLRTTQEVKLLSQEIDLLLGRLYQPGPEVFEKALETEVRAWFSQLVKKEIEKSEVDRSGFFKGLKEELKKMAIIKLTLAFEPNDSALNKFHGLVSDSFRQPVVLEIEVDPSILGGATITSQGKYFDFSLKKKLAAFLEKEKAKIVEAVK